MLQAVRLLTLISILIAACIFLLKPGKIRQNSLFFLFCLAFSTSEVSLYITADLGIKNHFIANIDNYVTNLIILFLLLQVWRLNGGNRKTIRFTKFGILAVFTIFWIAENFIFESFWDYNAYTTTVMSLLLVIISIYIVNLLLFVKTNPILRDSDGLLIIGLLIRCFATGMILLFFNYRLHFSSEFYINILILTNVGLIISNILFIFSILCLPQRRKYTWPF